MYCWQCEADTICSQHCWLLIGSCLTSLATSTIHWLWCMMTLITTDGVSCMTYDKLVPCFNDQCFWRNTVWRIIFQCSFHQWSVGPPWASWMLAPDVISTGRPWLFISLSQSVMYLYLYFRCNEAVLMAESTVLFRIVYVSNRIRLWIVCDMNCTVMFNECYMIWSLCVPTWLVHLSSSQLTVVDHG